MVTLQDVQQFLQLASKMGITLYLDGGWGVDALLGRQTREHNDVDLFAEGAQYASFVQEIKSLGFAELLTEYTTEDHTVWQDAAGRLIDLHRFCKKDEKTILYDGMEFPSTVFSGKGSVGGMEVSCINACDQVAFHLGYEHDEKDVQDVLLLCKTFGIPVPEEYRD